MCTTFVKLLDEIFGAANFVAHDVVKETTGRVSELLAEVRRLLALVREDTSESMKYRQLFKTKEIGRILCDAV